LRAFRQPVFFVVGGRSNPDYYGRMADRAREIFTDFTLDVFEERHHFDPHTESSPNVPPERCLRTGSRVD
jgi:hypothetical protein